MAQPCPQPSPRDVPRPASGGAPGSLEPDGPADMGVGRDQAREGDELVAAARLGDREAFEVLALEAMPMLMGTARRLVGGGYAAEEAVAEALFRAWRRVDSFRGSSAFGTWMHRILCRAIADRYRTSGRERARRVRYEARLKDGGRVGGQPAGEPAPWRLIAARDDAARWETLLGGLPPTQRLVLLLHAWEHLSLTEIAETLQLRYATVKSNLHHARRKLRAAWDASSEAQHAVSQKAVSQKAVSETDAPDGEVSS